MEEMSFKLPCLGYNNTAPGVRVWLRKSPPKRTMVTQSLEGIPTKQNTQRHKVIKNSIVATTILWQPYIYQYK